jgi:hypothetical protein
MLMLMRAEGNLDTATDDDIAFFMRIKESCWLETRGRLLATGLLSDNGDAGYDIPSWGRRQPKWDHSSERVKLWRKEHTCPDCKSIDKQVQLSTSGDMVFCPVCLHK